MNREYQRAIEHVCIGKDWLSNGLSILGDLLIKEDSKIKPLYNELFDILCKITRLENELKKLNK